MPLGSYLCGCKIGPRRGYPRRYVGGYTDKNGNQVGGTEVCPEHESMPYGFLSTTANPSRVVVGDLKISAEILVKPDQRDNRDPQSKEVQLEVKRALAEI